MKSQNHTNIVLIPKNKNLTYVSYYRRISSCNVSIGIVAKVLTNRLKPILIKVISSPQSTFLSSRSFFDNVVIVHECLTILPNKKKSKKKGSCSFKTRYEQSI